MNTHRTAFPTRSKTENAIIEVLREHGGSVSIQDKITSWTIYDAVAARLGVSADARNRRTRGTGERAWRPEVGYARKNLERRGIIKPTAVSGRGIWELTERYR
jgi:hypothetical protein